MSNKNSTLVTEAEKIAESTNVFAIKIYKKLNNNMDNVVFSPFGVAIGLGMLFMGGRGKTAKEIARALHFKGSGDSLSRGMAYLLTEFHKSFDQISLLDLLGLQFPGTSNRHIDQLNIATALWVQRDFPIEQLYRDWIRKYYGGAIIEVNFDVAEQARGQINAFISEKTRGKINEALPGNIFKPSSNPLAVGFINTIYFSGRWFHPFDPQHTRDQPFYLLDGKIVSLPFMHRQDNFRWAENDKVQYIELPYRGEALVMGILLPNLRDGLPQLETDLTIDQLLQIVNACRYQKLDLYLPRFKIDSMLDLPPIFRRIGIVTALDQHNADFSALTKHPIGVYLSEALHRVCIDVDEEGTVVAAMMAYFARSKGISRNPIFKADHPFLFFIRHTVTGQMLFIGRWTGKGQGETPGTSAPGVRIPVEGPDDED